MSHVFHPDAGLEFEEAVRFYRARGRTLGDRLALEVRAAIRKILETPERWRVIEGGVRRCRVRVFPYSVLYTVEPDYIMIVAIMHSKREPGYWQQRLKSKPTP